MIQGVLVNRILDRVLVGDACWEWTGAHLPEGYSIAVVRGENVGVHRIMYELFVGEIPEGMEPDHLCRNTGCVRPTHLEAVTHAENIRRGHSPAGINARRTECAKGHPFDDANTGRRTNGNRYCRECGRAASRAWKARQKVAA